MHPVIARSSPARFGVSGNRVFSDEKIDRGAPFLSKIFRNQWREAVVRSTRASLTNPFARLSSAATLADPLFRVLLRGGGESVFTADMSPDLALSGSRKRYTVFVPLIPVFERYSLPIG